MIKNTLLTFGWILTIALIAIPFSCKKDVSFDPYPSALKCWGETAWWADSFGDAPGAIPPGFYMMEALGLDSMAVRMGANNIYGWHLNQDNRVLANMGYSGKTSTEIKAQFLLHPELHNRSQVFHLGRNNATDTAQIAQDLDEMIGTLNHDKFLVIGILTGDWDTERPGTGYFARVHAFNAWLAAKYTFHYIDPLPPLLGLANGSMEDTRCVLNEVSPTSVRLDQLHLNTTGCKALGIEAASRIQMCETIAN